MKTKIGWMLLAGAALLAAGCVVYAPPQGESGPVVTAPAEEPAYDTGEYESDPASDYYGYLGPYGQWVSYPDYGYVWIPRNPGHLWRPYTLGHWVWTDDGWTWLSTEHWGWLVYHYGRWGFDFRLGWYWVPGRVWGPAWVAWRWGDAYIGWAPLPPGADFIPGRGFARHDFDIPGQHWNFVHGRDFTDRSLDRYIMPADRNVTVINRTTYKVNIHANNNRIINDGVDLDHVRRMTGRPVERLALKDSVRPGDERVEGRDAVIYRPQIRTREGAKPKNVVDRDQALREVGGKPAPREKPQPQQQRQEEQRQQPDQQRPKQGQIQQRVPRPNDQYDQAQMEKRQRDERTRLDRDQQNEINQIRRKADTDKAAVRTPAERQKIDAATKSRLAEVRKRQQTDKAKLAEKQKADAAAAAKARNKEKVPAKEKSA